MFGLHYSLLVVDRFFHTAVVAQTYQCLAKLTDFVPRTGGYYSQAAGAQWLNRFRTAVPFWGQTTPIPSSLSPKRDCGFIPYHVCTSAHQARMFYCCRSCCFHVSLIILCVCCVLSVPDVFRRRRCWQVAVEAVILQQENGSMAQRVQAEFLSELCRRIEVACPETPLGPGMLQ